MRNKKMTREELLEKGYKLMTYKKVNAMKTDISILSIPRQVVCEDALTYNGLLSKFQKCHIGTSSTFINLTITS